MPNNAQELERLFITIIADDSKLEASMKKAIALAKRSSQEIARAFREGSSKGFEDAGVRVEASARRQKAAIDPVKEAIAALKNESHSLRQITEAGAITTADASKRFEVLRDKALKAAEGFTLGTKEHRGYSAAAATAARSIKTLAGQTTLLGFSGNNAVGVSAALRQNIHLLGPAAGIASRNLGLLGVAFGGFARTGPGVTGSIDGMIRGFTRLNALLPLVAVAAGGAAIAGLVKLGNAAAVTADAIDKGSRSAGLSAESYQELQYAFDQNGVSAEKFDNLMQGLNQRLGQAADGSKTQAEAFAKLGVSIRDASGNIRGTEEVLVDVIAGLEALPSSAERAAAGMDTLGRQGRSLGSLLDTGIAGIDALRESARSAGLVISGQAVLSLVQYKDAMATLSRQFETARVEIAAAFIPLLTNVLIPLVQNVIVPAFQNAANTVSRFTETFLDQSAAGAAFRADIAGSIVTVQAIASAFVSLGRISVGLVQILTSPFVALGQTIGTLSVSLDGFLDVYRRALRGDFSGFLQSPAEILFPKDAVANAIEATLGQARAGLENLVDGSVGLFNAFDFETSTREMEAWLDGIVAGVERGASRFGEAGGDAGDAFAEGVQNAARGIAIEPPAAGSLAAWRAAAAEARKEFENGVTTEARAGALAREAIAQAEIDKILATFNVDPFRDARIWTDRLAYELEAGLKDATEVFNLLNPAVEKWGRNLENAYLEFGIDSEKFREALGKLGILQAAVKRLGDAKDITIRPTVEFDVNLTSPGEVRRYVEELRSQLDELTAEATRANRAGDVVRATEIGQEMLALSQRIDTLTASFGEAADASQRLAESQAGLRAFEDFGGGTVGLTAFQKAVQEIEEALQAALGEGERFSRVLGGSFDLTSASAQAFRSALDRYVRLGLDETDAEVQALIRTLDQLQERLAIEANPPSLNTADLRRVEDFGFFPTGALSEYQTKLNEVVATYENGIRSIEAFAGVMGDDFDDASERAALLQRTIRSFTDLGLDASVEQVAELVEQLRDLQTVAGVDVNAGDAIRANVSAQLAGAAAAAEVFGTQSELAALKTNILETAIKSLLLLDPEADIADLVLQWELYSAGVDGAVLSTRNLEGAQAALGSALQTLDQLSGNVPSQFDTLATAFRNAERAGIITKEALEELLGVIDQLARVDAAAKALNDLAGKFDIGGQIMDGLTTTLESVKAGDLQGALSGLTSVGVAIGTAIGGPAAGALVGAIGGALQSAVGLFQSLRDLFTGDSKARRDLARTLSSTVAGAFRSGILDGMKGGADWQKNLSEGVREAVVGALIDAFIQAAIVGAIFAPFIDEFTKTLNRLGPDAAWDYFDREFPDIMGRALDAATELVERGKHLFPNSTPTTTPDPLATTGTIELPNATVTVLAAPQWALELNRSAERMSAAGDAMLEAAILMQTTFREGVHVNTTSTRGIDAQRVS